jgi:hypothetical protein
LPSDYHTVYQNVWLMVGGMIHDHPLMITAEQNHRRNPVVEEVVEAATSPAIKSVLPRQCCRRFWKRNTKHDEFDKIEIVPYSCLLM